MIRKLIRLGLVVVLASIVIGLGIIDLERVPPLWWDEGWTMLVARTWVERGFYGRLLNGELVAPGLNAAFPTTASVALSFKVFGVGVSQARLPGLLYTAGSLALLFLLARRLYDWRVALATLGVAMLMPILPDLQPWLMGRQVLAEMPGLFFLLAGYAIAINAISRAGWQIALAGVLWAVALHSKLQFQPFWLVSLGLTVVCALINRWQRAARVVLACGLVAGVAYVGLGWLRDAVLAGRTLPMPDLANMLQSTALVLAPVVRLEALQLALTFGLPTVLGVAYTGWRWRHTPDSDSATYLGQALVLGMVGSWLLWFVALSAAWSRYLFPAVFVGSMFVAVLLADLTQCFDLHATFAQAGAAFRRRRYIRSVLRVLAVNVAVIVVVVLGLQTVRVLLLAYVRDGNSSAQQVAETIDAEAASGTLIETYDSELFFFLNSDYHYPPDQTHVVLNRRTFLGEDVPIDYDPLAADPDYLIVGPFSRQWKIYDPVLASGAFRLQSVVGEYDIYRRLR